MLADVVPTYQAIVAIVVLATLVPPFAFAAYSRGRFRILLSYSAGLVCGIAVLYAETHFLNFIRWDEVFYVVFRPLVGMAAGAAWRSKSRPHLIGSSVLVTGALLIVVMNARSLPARIDLPFAAGSKGAVAADEFYVPTTMTYTFHLDLRYTEGDSQERERLRALAGTGQYRDGRQINTGLPIPVRLRVDRIDKNGVSSILDSVFTDHDLESHGWNHFSKLIRRIRLQPARYRARIEALENIPELQGVPVHFGAYVRSK